MPFSFSPNSTNKHNLWTEIRNSTQGLLATEFTDQYHKQAI